MAASGSGCPSPSRLVRATCDVSVVTVLPPASSNATTGCVAKAVPPAALTGWVVKAICAAGPSMTFNGSLVAVVSCPSVARSLYPVPTVLIAHPLNVKTPFFSPVDVQVESVPGPPLVGVLGIERDGQRRVVRGNGITGRIFDRHHRLRAEGLPPVAPLGWLEKANLLAAPAIPPSAMPTMGLLRAMAPV